MSDLEEIEKIIAMLPEEDQRTIRLLTTAIKALVMSHKSGVLALSLVGIELQESIESGDGYAHELP